MKSLIINILIFLIHPLISPGNPCLFSALQPDSIPPPPPGEITSLTGPAFGCTGDTSDYFVDVPVGCLCQWSVNDSVRPDTLSVFRINWPDPGDFIVSVVFISAGGQASDPQYLITEVGTNPFIFLGNDTTLQPGQTLLLDAGNPGSSYSWSTGDTTRTILVSQPGIYSVTVSNACGSGYDEISVTFPVGVEEAGEDNRLILSISGPNLRLTGIPANTGKILVSDITGKWVYHGKPFSEIDLPGTGIYVLKIISPDTILTEKILIR